MLNVALTKEVAPAYGSLEACVGDLQRTTNIVTLLGGVLPSSWLC